MQERARSGDAAASFELGQRFESGDGAATDLSRAFAEYQRAAIAGHEPAYPKVADAYLDGRGTDADATLAYEWYERASQSGDLDAIVKAARMAQLGIGTPVDLEKARERFALAADRGDPLAQYSLASLIRSANDADADAATLARVESLYLSSAAQRNVDAEYALGLLYRDGDTGTPDPAEAQRWFERAAEQGDMRAQLALADLLTRPSSRAATAQNTAYRLYESLSRRGNLRATHRLAEMTLSGSGTSRDAVEAARLFQRNADAGYAPSQCELGNLHYRGVGVSQDFEAAARWYHLASRDLDTGIVSLLGIVRTDCKRLR